MARDINKYLNQLQSRRRGIDRLNKVAKDAQLDLTAKSALLESWQQRAQGLSYTRYALGAMQEVDTTYTNISIETARRVEKQLENGLNSSGLSVIFRLQGSVPLNIHIRGVSDVDLLTIDTSYFIYDRDGRRSKRGMYTPSTKTSVEVLSKLRCESEKILKDKYPSVTVDTSGAKSINLCGGSLARPVDVVPAHWYDTVDYQVSEQEHDRGIIILNKKTQCIIENLPFLHIKLIRDRCNTVNGGLRKAIRLCKNVKADAEEAGTEISLSSFDIAAAMYHADINALHSGNAYELSILAETQRHLDALACNHEYAKTLMVPDGSRAIFDSNTKLNALDQLSTEIDDLVTEVARENRTILYSHASHTLAEKRGILSSAYFPTI